MKLTIISLFLITGVFVFLFPVMERHAQSFMFVDENEHIVVGKLMNQDYTLYQDISTNHQPIPYIISTVVQKYVPINTMYLALKRHREIIFLWSFTWSILLLIRFGTKAFVPILLFEFSKYLLLGNEFLAESLVAYPFSYVVGVAADQVLLSRTRRDDVLVGVAAGLCVFLSIPLLLPLSLALFEYYRRLSFSRHRIILAVVGLAIIAVGVFLFVHPIDYFRETIINNLSYAIPRLSKIHSTWDWLKVIGLPLASFMKDDIISRLIQLASAIFIGGAVWSVVKREGKLFKGLLFIGIIWTLGNVRDMYPIGYFYDGFHLLPWLLAGLTASSIALHTLWPLVSKKVRLGFSVSIGVLLLVIGTHSGLPIYAQKDPLTDHYIQFTPFAEMTRVLSFISTPEDTLIVHPADSVIHWMSNIPPAAGQVSYYEWQFYPPANQYRYRSLVVSNPPEFIVFANDNSAYTPSLTELLAARYRRIFTFYRNTEPTGLYVLDTKWQSITPSQWKALAETQLPIEGSPTQE